MEGLSVVPKTHLSNPNVEEIFVVSSNSISKKNQSPPDRCRVSLLFYPTNSPPSPSPTSKSSSSSKGTSNKGKKDKKGNNNKKNKKGKQETDDDVSFTFKEGTNQFTANGVREQILSVFNNYSSEIDYSEASKKQAKFGGLDIEGSTFVASTQKGEPHKLLLGLRGPITKDNKAVIVSLDIPQQSKQQPDTWKVNPKLAFLNLGNYTIRDMSVSSKTGQVYLLVGSQRQDKYNNELTVYPVWKWDMKTNKCVQVGGVPRIKMTELKHQGLEAAAWKEYGVKGGGSKEAKKDVEKETDMCSPEGINIYEGSDGKERMLVVWDNNDVGAYSDVLLDDFVQ